jgi:hypothetical protein
MLRLADDPDQLVVYSIDGAAFWRTDGELTPELRKGELLHGIPVIGKVDAYTSHRSHHGRKGELCCTIFRAHQLVGRPRY